MAYAELSDEEKIILAAECVGQGVPIPHEIAAHLGHELISLIQNPEPVNADTRGHGTHQP